MNEEARTITGDVSGLSDIAAKRRVEPLTASR
jgi:hypothetical protein